MSLGAGDRDRGFFVSAACGPELRLSRVVSFVQRMDSANGVDTAVRAVVTLGASSGRC